MSWMFSSLILLSQVGAHLIQSGHSLQLEILQKVPLSTSPLSAPDFKVTQALLPTNAVNDLAKELWVNGSSSSTDYIVMGVPSMHWEWARKKETKMKAGFFSYRHIKEQTAPLCCPLLVTYIREIDPDTVLGRANSWTPIFPKHILRAGGAKGSRQVKL